jgi:hypothetical protein
MAVGMEETIAFGENCDVVGVVLVGVSDAADSDVTAGDAGMPATARSSPVSPHAEIALRTTTLAAIGRMRDRQAEVRLA